MLLAKRPVASLIFCHDPNLTKKIKTQGIKLKNTVKSATPEEKKDPK